MDDKETKLEQLNTGHGRYYRTPEGKIYPSVTTIVGLLNAKRIYEWRKRVGEEVANKVSTTASGHGTRWHTLIEEYLKGERPAEPMGGGEFWLSSTEWLKTIYPRISNIRGVEMRSYSDDLKCAGTIDLVADWDGQLAIIDWKTTSHEKQAGDVASYWCQLAAYAYMFYERTGEYPEKMVLVFNQSDQEIYHYEQNSRKWLKIFEALNKKFRELKHLDEEEPKI